MKAIILQIPKKQNTILNYLPFTKHVLINAVLEYASGRLKLEDLKRIDDTESVSLKVRPADKQKEMLEGLKIAGVRHCIYIPAAIELLISDLGGYGVVMERVKQADQDKIDKAVIETFYTVLGGNDG